MKERLRKVWSAVNRVGSRVAAVWPLTWLGAILLAGSVAALWGFGIKRIDLLLLVIGGVGTALVALTTVVTSVASLFYWRSLRKRFRDTEGDALKIDCGISTKTGFAVPSLWWVPFVRVEWRWRMPDVLVRQHRASGKLHEEVLPSRRALVESITRDVSVSDVFGISKVTFPIHEKRDVRFSPSVGALRSMHVVRSMSGGNDIAHPDGPPEGERLDMRNYVPGDPIRFILWKVFARTRQLVVRTPERAIAPVRQTVAYLVAGDGDEPAAGAARIAVDSGALGSEWVLGTDGTHGEHARSKHQALEMLSKSAQATEEDQGEGLAHFLQTSVPGSVGRCVVFVPARPGPWLAKVVAAARSRVSPSSPWSPVEFVVCTDGLVGKTTHGRIAKLVQREDTRDDDEKFTVHHQSDPDGLTKVVDMLSTARARILVVDRQTGRVLDGSYRVATQKRVA